MTVYETDLPGVGKKFEVEIGDGERVVVVTHNTGKREVHFRPHEGADSEKLFELTDELARTIGTILEGAYFQPVESEDVQTTLGEGTCLDWYDVEEGAELAGQTLAEARVRQRTGVSIVAIQREGTVMPSPEPETVVESGDTLVVIGSQEDVRAFRSLVSGDADDGT